MLTAFLLVPFLFMMTQVYCWNQWQCNSVLKISLTFASRKDTLTPNVAKKMQQFFFIYLKLKMEQNFLVVCHEFGTKMLKVSYLPKASHDIFCIHPRRFVVLFVGSFWFNSCLQKSLSCHWISLPGLFIEGLFFRHLTVLVVWYYIGTTFFFFST